MPIVINNGGSEVKNKAPQSIIAEILGITFQKLENREDFDSELIFKLKKVKFPGNVSTENKLISILRGESQ